MNTQLYKKNCNTGQSDRVYPLTIIENVINESTGETLDQILQQYNHIWLPFKGNSKTLTRQQVPDKLRRRGLWITYKSCAGKTTTEWYNSDYIDNTNWGKNDYWVQIVDTETINNVSKALVEWYKYTDKNEVHGNVKNLFHWYGSTAAFVTHKNQGLIPLDSIAFLHTGQVYVQGNLIGVSSEDFAELKKSVTKIENIFSDEGTGDVFDELNKVINILKGYTEKDNLKTIIDSLQLNKVDKEEGKGLSTNDFTNDLKNKLDSLSSIEAITAEELDEITNK